MSGLPDPGGPHAGRSRALRAAEFVLGVMIVVLLMAMMLVTTIDVFGRYLLSRPLPGAFEITEIMLAMTIFIGLPLVCLKEEHVAVTLLTERFRPRLRNVHAAIVSLACAGVLLVIAWRLVRHSLQLASYGDVTIFLRMPKGPIGYTMAGFTLLGALALLVVAREHIAAARAAQTVPPAGGIRDD
jgi:TRAP-type C4-dicarboxylate transport system permease small subunit